MHMSRALRKILEAINDEVSQDLLTSDRTENGDFLGVRSGWLTYLPAGKHVDKPYASRNRVRGKPARTARKFTAQDHTDSAYEAFHNAFEAQAFSTKNIAILKGEDIVRAYNEWYDTRKQSKTMKSCMVGVERSAYDLYVDNPNVVRLLVLWDRFKGKDVIVARALLWKTPEGIYVDRIYGSDTARTFLRNYVDRKGWLRYHDWGEPIVRRQIKQVRLDIVFEPKRFQAYPYLDTFALRRVDYTDRNAPMYLTGRITV